MIQSILVLGSGSAGLIAALTIKRKIPQVRVTIVRSPEIGIIGVGEGTTPNFPRHLFDYLGISRKEFYAIAKPTWKLGIRFLWGERKEFYYGFSQQLDAQWSALPKPNGYYCDDDFSAVDVPVAMMEQGKVFARQANGAPDVQPWHAFHIENVNLVECLERYARAIGVEIIDGKVVGAERGPKGISAVFTEDGRKFEADFYVDSSGFHSELLGKTLEEPFVSFDKSLFCDRAVVGGWERGADEPILPYTTAETMDSGWAWQIEHEHHVNRGYVYSSHFISDDQAAEEFTRKNPKAPKSPRVVKFRSGCYKRMWVDNVVAIGNAGGFVEPLEATALMVVCSESQTLVEFLLHSNLKPTETFRNLFNKALWNTWEEIRNFLALHYYANTRMDTPYWKACREETDISGLQELLAFYRENGPTGFGRHTLPHTGTDFGMEGYLVMMVGNKVPYQNRSTPTEAEWNIWRSAQAQNRAIASQAMTVKEALYFVHHPGWQWNSDAPPLIPK